MVSLNQHPLSHFHGDAIMVSFKRLLQAYKVMMVKRLFYSSTEKITNFPPSVIFEKSTSLITAFPALQRFFYLKMNGKE